MKRAADQTIRSPLTTQLQTEESVSVVWSHVVGLVVKW
jgi:hypothetical protein